MALPALPACGIWAWFKPATAPHAIFVRVPAEAWRDPRRTQPITLRMLLAAVGVDPRDVSIWSLYGNPADSQLLANPAWDFPIPEPTGVADPSIGIFIRAAAPAIVPQVVVPAANRTGTVGTAQDQVYGRIEADWYAILQIELQVDAAAKQLNATLLRISALNRDMSPEENRGADSQDKREWQEARRWLRDVSHKSARHLKDHTVGMTSNAGKRNGLESTYRQFIQPRRPFDGIEQAEREFESYRKSLQTLLTNLTSSQNSAVQDGERRAQQVMTRVLAKVRTMRTKRGT